MEFFDFSGTNEEEKAQALDVITQESNEVEFFFDYNINDVLQQNCPNACGPSFNHNNAKSLYHGMNGGGNSVLTNGAQHDDECQQDNSSSAYAVSHQHQAPPSDNLNQSLSFTSQQQQQLQHASWELATSNSVTTNNALSTNIQTIQPPNGAPAPVVRAAPQYIYHQPATPYFAPHNSLYPISPEQMQAALAAQQQQQHSVNSISNHSLKDKSLRMPYSSNNSSSNYKNSTKITSANNMSNNCDIRNSFYVTQHPYPDQMQLIDTNRLNSSAMPVSVNGGPIISESGIVASNGAPVGVPTHLSHPHHNQPPPAYGFPPPYPALFQPGPYHPHLYFFPPDGTYMHPYRPFPPNTAPAHMMAGVPHPSLIPSANSVVDMTSQSNQPSANISHQSMSSQATSNLSSSVSASSTSIAAAYHSSDGSQSDTPTSFHDHVDDANANINYSYSYSETSNDPISDKKETDKEMVVDDYQHNQNEQVPPELEISLKDDDTLQSNTSCPSKPETVSHSVYSNSFPSLARNAQSEKVAEELESTPPKEQSPNVELFSKLSSLQISMEKNETQNLQPQESNVKNTIIDTLFSSLTNNKPFASPLAQNVESNLNDPISSTSDYKTTQDSSRIVATEQNLSCETSSNTTTNNNTSSTWASKLFGSAPNNNVDNFQSFSSLNKSIVVESDEPNELNTTESTSEHFNNESYTYNKNSFINNSQQHNSRNYSNKNRSPNFDVDNDSTKINIIPISEDPVAFQIAKRLKESIKLKHALPTIMPRGLVNRGNWCYVNATLQALLACPPFYNLMREISETPRFFRVNTSTPIIDNFVRYFSKFRPTNLKRQLKSAGSSANSYLEELLKNDPIEPLCVYDTLKHIGMIKNDAQRGHQEDAEEFLSSVLNGLNEEMIAIANLLDKQADSKVNGKLNGLDSNSGHELSDNQFVDEDESAFDPNNDDNIWHEVGTSKHKALPTRSTTIVSTAITEIFGGSTLDVRTVNKDNNSCGNRQPFFTLQLDIKPSKINNLEDAIRWQTRPQNIQGYTCSKTKQIVEASSQMFLETLPPILILHLKLFDYDIETGVGRKLLKHINFTENLEIPRDCLSRNTDNRVCKRYILLGVVYHDGSEAAKGHYITDVYHLGLNQWLRCDDASISVISLPKVLAGREGNLVPYLLFYRRQDTLLTRSSSNAAGGSNPLSSYNNSGAHAPNGSNSRYHNKSPNDCFISQQQQSSSHNHNHPQHHHHQQQLQQHNEVHNINTSNKFSSISRH